MSNHPSNNNSKNRHDGQGMTGSMAVGEAFSVGRTGMAEAETPTMRSVAVMTGHHGGPSLGGLRKPPPLKSFAGMKPGPLGIPRASSLGPKSIPDGVFGVKQEWSGASKAYSWDVKAENLEMVPWEFPLERTHREINEDASCVANRITESLRALSVDAEFCSATAKAKCKTADYVVFRIRLFAGSDNGEPVVVEVQRRSGSASSFMRTCRAVLDAAEGKNVDLAKVSKRPPPFMKKPISSMKCLASAFPAQPNYESEASSELDKVVDMLRSDRRDLNILGLENLCSLTDPLKTIPAVSLLISKSVVLGDDKYDIREELRLLTERDVFADEEEDIRNGDHSRFLSLFVLANSLEMCSKDGCLVNAMKEQRWFSDQLVPSLADELKRVQSSQTNSFKAASCLHSMLSCSCDMCNELIENGCVDALEIALEVGKNRHELLANEAQRCLQVVRGV